MSLNRRDFIKLSAGAAGVAILSSACSTGKKESNEAVISKLRPMTDDIKPIVDDERKARIEKARRLMVKNNIDAIYLEPGKTMFYFTGMAKIKKIRTNHFVPGAVADHLTSKGGMLTGSSQMNSMRWLEAGATGSYGAVIEPCNFVQKFPNPGIMMYNYIRGNTLIEAYWKSVAWPGQGIFIGEPLAKPFASR